jgi:hypothetical protein
MRRQIPRVIGQGVGLHLHKCNSCAKLPFLAALSLNCALGDLLVCVLLVTLWASAS